MIPQQTQWRTTRHAWLTTPLYEVLTIAVSQRKFPNASRATSDRSVTRDRGAVTKKVFAQLHRTPTSVTGRQGPPLDCWTVHTWRQLVKVAILCRLRKALGVRVMRHLTAVSVDDVTGLGCLWCVICCTRHLPCWVWARGGVMSVR